MFEISNFKCCKHHSGHTIIKVLQVIQSTLICFRHQSYNEHGGSATFDKTIKSEINNVCFFYIVSKSNHVPQGEDTMIEVVAGNKLTLYFWEARFYLIFNPL